MSTTTTRNCDKCGERIKENVAFSRAKVELATFPNSTSGGRVETLCEWPDLCGACVSSLRSHIAAWK